MRAAMTVYRDHGTKISSTTPSERRIGQVNNCGRREGRAGTKAKTMTIEPDVIPPDELVRVLLETAARRQSEARTLVGIAGPPGSGKSTFALWLQGALIAHCPGLAEVVPMDGYHFDDVVLTARGWRARKGAPHTFDAGGLRAMLERLRANTEDEIAVPVFDRSLEIARAGARLIPKTTPLLLVEGNYLLLDRPPWTTLAPLFDLTVMLSAPLPVLRGRLLERWRDLEGDDLAQKLEGNDLPNARVVIDESRRADYAVDATAPLEGPRLTTAGPGGPTPTN